MKASIRLTASAFTAAFLSLPLLAATYDVRDYGASGDGVTKDTAAIQKAIDAASAAGGGSVELGAGTYLTGSLWLKSHVDVHLGEGAVLKGSGDIADYCASNCCPQNAASSRQGDNTTGGHLLLGVGVSHVTLRGPGKVDGNSPAFLLDAEGRRYPSKRAIPVRPGQMIWFVDSSDIRISDLEIANAPYWSCFVLNCSRVFIRGCYVHTDRTGVFNGDGLDIDRSQHVAISDCRIDAQDDCITLRASSASRLAKPQDCAWVTVDNCSLSSSCNGIRVGVGEGVIHDCVLSNITISDTPYALNIVGAYTPRARGTDIVGIRFANLRIDAKQFLWMDHRYATEALFRDIVFDGVSGKVEQPSVVQAKATRPFERISFVNVDLPCGVKLVNAPDVRFVGGTLKAL